MSSTPQIRTHPASVAQGGRAPEPPLTYALGSVPEGAHLAEWRDDDGGVSLGLPGIGRLDVGRDGIVVTAPDEQAADALLSRIGTWARAHWWNMQGLRVMRGTVVSRDEGAVALVGPERSGVSLLALSLVTFGWSVVSDGAVVVDDRDFALSVPGPVVVDAVVDPWLDPGLPRDSIASGRSRIGVTGPEGSGAPLLGYVSVRAREVFASLVVVGPIGEGGVAPALPSATACTMSPPRPLPVRPWWRVDRPVTADEAVRSASTPAAIALLLDALLCTVEPGG